MTEVASAVLTPLLDHDETRTTQAGIGSVEGRHVSACPSPEAEAGEDPQTASPRALEELEAFSNQPRNEGNVEENVHEGKERIPEEKEADEYVNNEDASGETKVELASVELKQSSAVDVIATKGAEQQPIDGRDSPGNDIESVVASEPAAKLEEQVKEETTEPTTKGAPVSVSGSATGLPTEMSTEVDPETGKDGLTAEAGNAEDVTETITAIADTDATDVKESESYLESEKPVTPVESRGQQSSQRPVEDTSTLHHVEEPAKEGEAPVVTEHVTEPEAVVAVAAADIGPSPVIEPEINPAEGLAQSEKPAVDAPVELSGLEPTDKETPAVTEPEAGASSDVPRSDHETAAQEESVVKEEEAPVAGQPAKEEPPAPAPETNDASVVDGVGVVDAGSKPQEVEGTVEHRLDIFGEVQNEDAKEQAAEKEEQDGLKPEDAGIGEDHETVKDSESAESTPYALEGETKPEVVDVPAAEIATDSEPQIDTSPPKEEAAEMSGATARRAYELAHAHANDEVTFNTPTDEEMKAASLEIVPTEKQDNSGVVQAQESDLEEQPQKVKEETSESQVPSSESAVAPTPGVNEAEEVEGAESEAQERLGGREASQEPEPETKKPLEQVVSGPGEQAETGDVIAPDIKGVSVEEHADSTNAAVAAGSSSEPGVVEQEDKLVSSDALLPATHDEPSVPAEIPSREVIAALQEVGDAPVVPEPSADAHTEGAPALTQKKASAPTGQAFIPEPATIETVEVKQDKATVQVLAETNVNSAESADKEPPAAEKAVASEPVEQSTGNEETETASAEQVEESKTEGVSAEEAVPEVAIHNVSAKEAPETAEEEGATEPPATPAAAKSTPSEELSANIGQVDELLREESAEQVAISRERPAVEVLAEAPAAQNTEAEKAMEDTGVPESAKPALQPEMVAEATAAEHDLKTAEDAEEQDVDVPDVSVETPTPMSETLTISSDEEGDDALFEERIVKVIDITPGETTKPTALDTSSEEARVEDEVVTPTEAEDGTVSEVKRKEVPAIETEDLETPSQSVLLERPETDADAAAAEVVNAEAPETRNSPWTPSYSVTTQGSSPMRPQPGLPPVMEDSSISSAGEALEEKANIEADAIPPASSVEEGRATDSAPIESPATSTPALETNAIETIPVENTLAIAAESDEPTDLPDAAVEQAPIVATEDRESESPSDAAAVYNIAVPVEAAPASLSVDTDIKEVPERPKSPWTPSYSVMTMGSTVSEPEKLLLDQDAPVKDHADAPQGAQQAVSIEGAATQSEAAETTPAIERPKSHYPLAYSVTQMGAGATEPVESVLQLQEPASPVSESGPASVADSNEPEAPLTPKSDLGIVTPGFDTLSEVSESSHIPIPPSSPRSDPEASSLSDEVKTPLVTGFENQGGSASPLQTPLISASKALESTEQLTESAVSGFGADVADTTATNSWVKENSAESDTRAEDSSFSSAAVDAVGVDQSINETASPENDTVKEVLQRSNAETAPAEDVSAPPELSIPKLDVTPAPSAAQPLIVTNTFSTDSAYTQISDALSPSQETETAMTTPDVESPPVSELHPNLDLESEAATSDSTVRPLPNSPQRGQALGVTHTLAMRPFPSAFTDSETSPASEQTNQPVTTDTHDEVDDLLSPLPADARRRLESTVSSLAFPGGWVSSPRKERTSLEVATGELSKPVVEAKPIVTAPTAEHPSEQKESRWRCVIM